jgi:hypothetical protein
LLQGPPGATPRSRPVCSCSHAVSLSVLAHPRSRSRPPSCPPSCPQAQAKPRRS